LFAHELAKTLSRTIAELKSTMDIHEYDRWKAYDKLRPLDHAMRAELSAGIIAGMIAAQAGSNSTASDFIVDWESRIIAPPPGEPAPDLDHKLDSIFGAFDPPASRPPN
jgi:hypothetical protein